MGQMKRILTDIAESARLDESETALDFDEQNHTDAAWFKMQDAEMVRDEMAQLEVQADVFDMQLNGYA